MKRRILKTGDRFNRLTYVKDLESSRGSKLRRRVMCLCDCGVSHEVSLDNLVRGQVRSCGCFSSEIRPSIRRVHGMTGTKTHRAWALMRDRCSNPNNKSFPDYGGRGIEVDSRWCSFLNFVEDMGIRPEWASSVERVDNSRGYEPGNCKWSTPEEQANNRRSNHLLTHGGVTQSISRWARQVGLKPQTLGKRISSGWSIEKAIFTVVKTH